MADLVTTEPKSHDSKNNRLFKWVEIVCGPGVAKFADSDNDLLKKILSCTIVNGGSGGEEPPPEEPPVGDPVADFEGDILSGISPHTVNFTNLSVGGLDTWSWNFGDGDTSTAQHPTHVYQSGGTYTVTLSASGPGGLDSETKVDYITVSESVNFSGTPLTGRAPLVVQFTNLSVGNFTSYLWDFGDSETSTATDPSHSYAAIGSYTVTLTGTTPGGDLVETKVAYVNVVFPPLFLDLESDLDALLVVSEVSQLDDQTGNNRHVYQAVDAARPTLVAAQLNGFPAIRFNGTSDFMKTALTWNTIFPMTWIAVLKLNSLTLNQRLIADIQGGNSCRFQVARDPSNGQTKFMAGTTSNLFGPVASTVAPYLVECRFSTSASAIADIGAVLKVNGVTYTTSTGMFTRPFNQLVLGCFDNTPFGGSTTLFGAMDFYCLKVWDDLLTDAELAIARAEVATKYGL